MPKPAKQQSNPYSTGSGGPNFETRVQAAFAVLMLTGRIAPCLPPFPITKIKLQVRYAGVQTFFRSPVSSITTVIACPCKISRIFASLLLLNSAADQGELAIK